MEHCNDRLDELLLLIFPIFVHFKILLFSCRHPTTVITRVTRDINAVDTRLRNKPYTARMTTQEKMLVLGVFVLGLVPAYGSYYFLHTHPDTLDRLNGTASAEKYVALSLAAEHARANAMETDIYQSKPQKTDEGFCAHSYYTSFVLTHSASGAVSLMQECESDRDVSRTWRGRTTPLQGVPEGITMKEFSFMQDGTQDPNPAVIRVQFDGDVISVLESSLRDLATSTRFTRLGAAVSSQPSTEQSSLRFDVPKDMPETDAEPLSQ
jgi:hypothetical protein